ncbi:translation initiation factor IF-2 [Candidatus Gastranaerophilus sp. (ex Termes propinquus)]|nr:translation initiation factor IF-2 [Candidatus Gastranaerophilus sp. (ex Termes propinquus)]
MCFNVYMRVHELAKELNINAKDLIDRAKKELDLTLKSHSATVSQAMTDKIRGLYKSQDEQKAKPKAFIVKKQKPATVEATVEEKEAEKTMESEKAGEVAPDVAVEPVRAKSRLEIVRPAPRKTDEAPQKPQVETVPEKTTEQEPPATQVPAAEPHRTFRATVQTRPSFEDRKKPIEAKRANAPEAPKGATSAQGAPAGVKKHADKAKEDATGDAKAPIKRHIISQDMYTNQDFRNKKKKKEGAYKNKQEEQERISLEKSIQGKYKKRTQATEEAEVITQVVIDKPMTVSELSSKIGKTPAEIIRFLMMEKIMVTVNTPIDIETSKKVAESFELEVLEEDIEAFMEEETEKEEKSKVLSEADEKLLGARAPVVTIMGHVDHGKTTLLDSIRAAKHKLVSGEVGGITQSIGAYTVWLDDKKIVFIDTPGHEAFTSMRMRGAQATDIAILVVAADDGVMPQTIEAVNHAKSAGVPIIVAVNKMDKPAANPDRVLQQLTEHGLVPEEWGGDTIVVKVSALQKTGIDELLEYILLVAEMQNLKAIKDRPGTGVIIEANLDKGKGPVATMLVQNGTVKVGDSIVVGTVGGKIRALLDDSGQRVKKAGPSTPVEVLGLNEVPQAGDSFEVVGSEKAMKQIVASKKQKERSSRLEALTAAHVKKDTVSNEDIVTLNLIIKANTHGSAEAVSQAIQNVKSKIVIPKIIHVGVGDISEADVMLAAASNAIILGFTVKEDANTRAAAEKSKVQIKKYDIIYQVLEDVEKTMVSLLEPEIKQVELGMAEVRQIFTVGKTGKIAGCYVLEGKIIRGKTAKVIRNNKEIFKGEIDQLKRFKEDVKEVATGFECGISFAKFNDLEEGDIIEVSTTEEIARSSLV